MADREWVRGGRGERERQYQRACFSSRTETRFKYNNYFYDRCWILQLLPKTPTDRIRLCACACVCLHPNHEPFKNILISHLSFHRLLGLAFSRFVIRILSSATFWVWAVKVPSEVNVLKRCVCMYMAIDYHPSFRWNFWKSRRTVCEAAIRCFLRFQK